MILVEYHFRSLSFILLDQKLTEEDDDCAAPGAGGGSPLRTGRAAES